MELHERVDEIIRRTAKSRSHLAKQLKIKQTTFNSWFSRERQHHLFPNLLAILEFYPHISRDWLFFGEGEMLKSVDKEPMVSQGREKELLLKIEQLSTLLVRLENQGAAAQ
jgi:AraC-like DNA-binding protein